MKFSLVLIGFVSLAARALARKADPRARHPGSPAELASKPSVIAQPVDNAVQLEFGLIQAIGDRTMCLAAVADGVELDIQLQVSNKSDSTQIWKFNKSQKTIKLSFLPNGRNNTQCLIVYEKPPQEYHLTVASCNGAVTQQQFSLSESNAIVSDNDTNYCMDVPSFRYKPGTPVIMYECKVTDAKNQQWIMSSI